MLSEFEAQHPEITLSWIRPAIVYGPGVDNYMSRMLVKHPLVVLPGGCNVPQQFVHEDDVSAAIWCILTREGRGSFNIGPPDWIYMTDVARETGRRTIKVPFWVMTLASRVCWGLRIPFLRYPPGVNFYIRYPWVVAPRRLCEELGFRFRFSSLETLREVLRSHGKLANDRAESSASVSSEHRRAA
jgi:UDP-glucose 4-epimerase